MKNKKLKKKYHAIKERKICGGLSLFHNRLIWTPFHISLSSSEILLFFNDKHSIYTLCHMSVLQDLTRAPLIPWLDPSPQRRTYRLCRAR
jgi:hypothetical protein